MWESDNTSASDQCKTERIRVNEDFIYMKTLAYSDFFDSLFSKHKYQTLSQLKQTRTESVLVFPVKRLRSALE